MNQETIEKYVHNELSPEERMAFDAALAADPALAAELHTWQQVAQTVTGFADAQAGMPALQQTLTGLNQQYFTPAAQKLAPVVAINRRKRWYAAIAAVAAVVIAVVVLSPLIRKSGDAKPDMAALYTAYAQYEPLSSGKARGDGNQMPIAAADSLYDAGNYAAALPLLEKYNEQNPADMGYNLALGVCYSKTGNDVKALRIFKYVADNGQHTVYAAWATWYEALHYLQQKDAAACREVLERIPPEADRYEKARELLKKL